MYTVYDVANYYLSKHDNITNKKLQKLVYYAYAWHLTLCNENIDELNVRLFPNKFEAWVHGAVYPDLWRHYNEYGSGYIPSYEDDIKQFSDDELDVLEQVDDVYSKYNGNELETINHQEDPWKDARGDCMPFEACTNQISDKRIFEYYSKEARDA